MTPRERARRVIPSHYEGSGWNQARDRAEEEIRATWNAAIEEAARLAHDETAAKRIRSLKDEVPDS
jgi:hypothetical protein